jgi:PAS domain S-box-containing protein
LNLTSWNFEKNGSIDLDGEWEFYWGKHLDPEGRLRTDPSARPAFIEVPGVWNDLEIDGVKITGDGYGTYGLTVLLPDEKERLALKFLDMAVAFSVFVNGEELASIGIPGKTRESTVPEFRPQVVEFEPESTRMKIVIPVSNFHHRHGGAWEPIKLGSANSIQVVRERSVLRSSFLAGGILIMGFYHIVLFSLRRRDKSALYFGIFCFLIAARNLTTGERYLVHLLPDLSWDLIVAIPYFSFYLAVPVFAFFVWSLFPEEVPKISVLIITGVAIVFSAIVLATKPRIYSHTIPVFQIFTIIVFGYGAYALALALKRRREGSLVFLMGFLILFGTAVNDILYSRQSIQTGYLVPYGLFVFIFFQAVLLSIRFSRSFSTVEKQHLELTKTNFAYEEEIRTRKKVEKALRASEERFRHLAELLPEPVYEMDTEGHLMFVNRAASDAFGYDNETMISDLNAFDMFVPADRDRARQNASKILDGARSRGSEYTALRKDGSTFPAIAYSSPIVRDGERVGLRGIIADNTERKRLEARLQHAHKMEAIGTLAGGIAHDFNNMLTPIMAHTELALRKLKPGIPIREDLHGVLRAAERAADVVQQLLSFSRREEQKPQPTELHLLLRETIKLLRASIPATIEIKENINPSCGKVMADATQIHQVLVNLCTNAQYAMREKGGVLEVTLDRIDVDPRSPEAKEGVKEGGYVRLAVSDTGHGMESETRGKIFDPYFTTKRVGEGSGLGLAVVHGIVASHGGHITVHSEPGQGSVFCVYFPRFGYETPQPARGLSEVRGGSERVLFVDDEPPVATAGERMLASLGYWVTALTSSEEALERFRARPERYDLVVTDQTLPRMTGTTLAQELLRIRPDLPIVICTGHSEGLDHEKAKAIGAKMLLTKPFGQKQLGEAVRKALDEK